MTRSCGSLTTPSESSLLHGHGRFAIELPLFLGLALVVKLLSAHDGDLDLDLATLEIEPQRNDGESLLDDLLAQLFDLASMQQQLPIPLRLMVLQVAVRVRRDVRVEKKRLAVLEDDVRVLDVR